MSDEQVVETKQMSPEEKKAEATRLYTEAKA
jgi:hypothetical protein